MLGIRLQRIPNESSCRRPLPLCPLKPRRNAKRVTPVHGRSVGNEGHHHLTHTNDIVAVWRNSRFPDDESTVFVARPTPPRAKSGLQNKSIALRSITERRESTGERVWRKLNKTVGQERLQRAGHP